MAIRSLRGVDEGFLAVSGFATAYARNLRAELKRRAIPRLQAATTKDTGRLSRQYGVISRGRAVIRIRNNSPYASFVRFTHPALGGADTVFELIDAVTLRVIDDAIAAAIRKTAAELGLSP